MPESRRWENTSSTRTSSLLTDILRRLPRIWAARARARDRGQATRTRICEVASSVSRIPFPHLPQAGASVLNERW